MKKARESLINTIREDLIGPLEENEVISDYPSDRYLTGILYPSSVPFPEEEDDKMEMGGGDSPEPPDDEARVSGTMRPSVAGISFAIASDTGKEMICQCKVSISCARYIPDAPVGDDLDSGEGAKKRKAKEWIREPLSAEFHVVLEAGKVQKLTLDDHGLTGLSLRTKCVAWAEKPAILCTAVLVNEYVADSAKTREVTEQETYFQVSMRIEACEGNHLMARPVYTSSHDEDGRMNALLYRNAVEFATGHTCSASWQESEENGKGGKRVANWVATEWLPRKTVYGVSAEGDIEFAQLTGDRGSEPILSSTWLSGQHGQQIAGLSKLVDCYHQWIKRQKKTGFKLSAELKKQADVQLGQCEEAHDRMKEAVGLLSSDEDAMKSFRLANAAMALQRQWSDGKELVWRPFQLAFLLMVLPSLADPKHEHRKFMDLLWFPTGGGKTEAYLGILAFLFFFRRIRHGVKGQGVAALMRYTLRLLTVQQFQRASAMVLACELIRRGKHVPEDMQSLDLGEKPFSIGLWVGSGSTPNDFNSAISALGDNSDSTPRQLKKCPCCKETLEWQANDAAKSITARCENKKCELHALRPFPVWTIDDDIYRELPTFVVGTVDKFAQITRKTAETMKLFGIGQEHLSPDLILQDELHLISGPLGTMTAIYEATIDELCRKNTGLSPKIIGSTATIRRASEQISAIFDRVARQFPPPAIDAENCGFAVIDPKSDGRVYLGLSTSGRSAKFSLQAVSASILQAVGSMSESGAVSSDRLDPYWTLVVYFNSLRELGGAFVLMQDDVPDAIELYNKYRGGSPRKLKAPIELTSRVASSQIPEILDQLETKHPSPEAEDILLASNMISVGVDIPRLGAMVVNGQPKTIAEYIQATSRVGRGVPGLVLTMFNAYKPRDRAYYETFVSWHSALYRDVEATSVTPFAPRARDRALHAAFVAAVRALVPGFLDNPKASLDHPDVSNIVDLFVERASRIDQEEADGVRCSLEDFIGVWKSRQDVLQSYWDDHHPERALLISAEKAASLSALGRHTGGAWATPNSMRSVEPGTRVKLVVNAGYSGGRNEQAG